MISCIFNLKMQISQNKIHAGIHEKNHRERKFFGKFIERTTKIKLQREQIK
jgi:hypothetical protein